MYTDDGLLNVISDEDTIDWGVDKDTFIKEYHPTPLIVDGEDVPF